MRFFAYQHVRTNTDFQKIKSKGVRESLGVFALQIAAPSVSNSDSVSMRRFGVVASKRVGIAVKRNRAKRVFREIFRLNQEVLPSSCDVILIPYSNFEKCTFEQLQDRYKTGIAKLLKKIDASRI